MQKWLAMMLVLLRPLMRELLKGTGKDGNGQELCDEVGPLYTDGMCFDAKKLRMFFREMGTQLITLPYWGHTTFCGLLL